MSQKWCLRDVHPLFGGIGRFIDSIDRQYRYVWSRVVQRCDIMELLSESWNVAELTMVMKSGVGTCDGIDGGGEIMNCSKK